MNLTDPLDHALFQLTPTRTRCDLLVSTDGSGGRPEKIASGLLEPFLSHLGCLRDQASKGGYSITLRPAGRTYWFTRATLERFVQFVSTPEILERVVSIEKEILQIENSIHLGESTASGASKLNGIDQTNQENMSMGNGNSKKFNAPSKLKDEYNCAQAENSKLCLQRALDSRKAMLQKEQGMAYARASVAGFDLSCIDDLLSFSNAFGATRLREACLNFSELCKRKEKDKHWMDELAAMEACSQPDLPYLGSSGITLISELVYSKNSEPVLHKAKGQPEPNRAPNGAPNIPTCLNVNQDTNLCTPSQESSQAANGGIIGDKSQVPISWPNHPPQYMYNFQISAQKTSPYPGFAFPGMQLVSPYYPGHPSNMQWAPSPAVHGHNIYQDADDHQRSKKPPNSKGRSLNWKAHRSKHTSLASQVGYSDDNSSSSKSRSDADLDQDDLSDTETLKRGVNKRSLREKNSRTVVIRNINYISSNRRDGGNDGSLSETSLDDAFVDGELLKHEVQNVVNSLQKHHKSAQLQHIKQNDNSKLRSADGKSDNSINDTNADLIAKACNVEKSDESWRALQKILMKDDDSRPNDLQHMVDNGMGQGNNQNQMEIGYDYCIIRSPEPAQESAHGCLLDTELETGMKKKLVAADPIATCDKDANFEDVGHMENFECDENYCEGMKKRHYAYDDSSCMQNTKPESYIPDSFPGYTNELPIYRSQRGGDWFVATQSDELVEEQVSGKGLSIFHGNQAPIVGIEQYNMRKDENKVLIDDSFVVPERPTEYEQPTSQWESDMSIVSGIAMAGTLQEFENAGHSEERIKISHACEPDDLQIVLERNAGDESFGVSWMAEIDHTADITYTDVDKRNPDNETTCYTSDSMPPSCEETQRNKDIERKCVTQYSKNKTLLGSLAKNKSEVLPRNRKPPTMSKDALQKSKMQKEEENRKRIEELLVERQKRIAQRSVRNSSATATFRENNKESKGTRSVSNHDKTIPRFSSQVMNKAKLYELDATNSTKDQHVSGRSRQNVTTSVINVKSI